MLRSVRHFLFSRHLFVALATLFLIASNVPSFVVKASIAWTSPVTLSVTTSSGVIHAGDNVTYTFELANNGFVNVNVTLQDDYLGTIVSAYSLPIGSSANFTCTANPLHDVTDNATATVTWTTDMGGGSYTVTASASVYVISTVSIAYICSADVPSANSFKSLLDGNGYATTLISQNTVATANLTAYSLIIAGNDTGSDYDWVNADAVASVRNAHRPVLGTGFGGARLLQQLGLSINWANGWTGSETGVYVLDASHPIFDVLDIPSSNITMLYSASQGIGEFGPSLSVSAVPLGRALSSTQHFTLVKEGMQFLWGFGGSPDAMTEYGTALFCNVVKYMIDLPVTKAPDLMITDFWSENNIISYQIMNIGDAPAPRGHAAALLVNGELKSTDVVDADMAPGERLTRSFVYQWQTEKLTDLFAVVADYTNVVAESNEANNRLEKLWKFNTVPPRIVQGPSALDVSQSSATISWTTDNASNSLVGYGKIAGLYPFQKSDAAQLTTHSINLTGLEANTTYHYVVQSTDASGNSVLSRDETFATLPPAGIIPAPP